MFGIYKAYWVLEETSFSAQIILIDADSLPLICEKCNSVYMVKQNCALLILFVSGKNRQHYLLYNFNFIPIKYHYLH